MVNEQFGISAIGTPLLWSVFPPNPALFPPPWNAVVVLHGGGWSTGVRSWEFGAARDFADAGMIAMSADYELTIDWLAGQSELVSWPNQWPDVALAVLAARDPEASSALFGKVTGKVGIYGGSAGGTLAVDTALRGTAGADRPDVVVALSANYNFANQDSLDQYETQGTWLDQVLLYNNVADRSFVEQLYSQSLLPLALAADPAEIPPLYMVQADAEAIGPPTSQMTEMVEALGDIGFTNYVAVMVEGTGHAKDNWNKINPDTNNTIKIDVLDYFQTKFLNEGGGEDEPTSGFRLTLTGGTYTIVGAINGNILPEDNRTAIITDLQGAADPGRLYTGELIHFGPTGDSEPATTTFRVIAPLIKGIPWGAYKLLTASGNDFWTALPADDTLAFSYIKGYRARTGIDQMIPGGVYDFSNADEAFELMAENGKVCGFSVASGVATTAHWYDEGGDTEVDKIAIDPAYISPQAYQPVFWDPNHLAKVQDLVTYMGLQYDLNPTISYIVVSHFMWGFQGFVSGTALDDAKWEQAALDHGYGSKEEAYFDSAKTIIGMFITAFPNTQLYFSQGKPFFEYNGDQNELLDWIIDETNHRCGVMTTGQLASEAPHEPPTIATYPKGAQAMSPSTQEDRFYGPVPPDPYPDPPTPCDDLMKHTATQGRTFIEMYASETDDPDNEEVIIANNIILESIVPDL